MMNEKVTVYIAVNRVDGKEYVGITRRELAVRAKFHKYDKGRGCRVFGLAIKKHGFENFHFEEVFSAFSWDDACWAEQWLIAERQTKAPQGYNLTAGGDGVRQLKLTPEHKAAVSAAQKGRRHSDAERQSRSEGLRRYHASLTPEQKQIYLAKTAPGRAAKISSETRAKMNLAAAQRRGVKLSAETRQKMSDSRRGKPRSPETWVKIRTGHRRYWEQKRLALKDDTVQDVVEQEPPTPTY